MSMSMKNPVHPGAVLREDVIEDLGLSLSEAAQRLGVSRVSLSRVIHEHARVSPNLAIRLEEAGVGTARAWLAMQTAIDLAGERAAGVPKVRKLAPVA
jgi:addiction module HigA family antidote